MSKRIKNKSIPIIVLIICVLLISVGASYAFFTANLTGDETQTTITVKGGTMNITYSGGSAITVSNIYPKTAAWVTKTITVTGNSTTTINMPYTLKLNVTANTFSASALKWQLTSPNTGSNGTPIPAKATNQDIASGTSNILLGSGTFTSPTSGAKAHTYVLTIYFPDTDKNQNTDQGKNFEARVNITGS